MIEQATAITNDTRADTGYKSWEAAGKRAIMRLDINDRTAGPIPSFGTMVHETALAAQGAARQAYAPHGGTLNAAEAKPDIAYNTGEDEFSFGDVIDMINPLHHLPVIGMLYRNVTGDTIKPISNIIGGALFGGPVGAVSSTVNAIVKMETGKDVAENALSFVGINVGGEKIEKPDLDYIAPVSVAATNAGDAAILAAAEPSARVTAYGAKNFAAVQKSSTIFLNA